MLLLSSTLLFFLGLRAANAGSIPSGGACSTASQRLEIGTYEFYTECDAMTYCSSSGVCEPRGCRKDQYPFGYSDTDTLPPLCGSGEFCPDEMDQCLPIMPVGSACQFNRDDQCDGPPNHKKYVDTEGFGRNINGSVCLNNVCMWANLGVGESCVVQNTVFVAFGDNGNEYPDIVSRDNCMIGTYCDSADLICKATKDLGVSCSGNKECTSYNCKSSGVCDVSADKPRSVATWVYGTVAACAVTAILITFLGMFLFHKREREQERGKRIQYWREQHSLRQGLWQMRKSAYDSLPDIVASHSKGVRSPISIKDEGSFEDVKTPMSHGVSKSSGLRFSILDDTDSDECLITQRKDVGSGKDTGSSEHESGSRRSEGSRESSN